MAIKFADTARPNNSTTEAKGTFPVAMAYDVWMSDGESVEEAMAHVSSIQVSTFPTATVDNLGTIYQYIGTTNQNYTNGLFYQCQIVDDGQGGTAYAWIEKSVNDSISVSAEPDNQIETKTDGIYVAPQTNAINDVQDLPTGTDIENTFYRTKDSTIQIYFGDSLESSLAVFDEWIQDGYVTKDTIGDDTIIEAATGYEIYFVDNLGNKVKANSFKYTVESPNLSIYWYDTSDEEHFVGYINMTSGTPYYDNKYWCVPNVANNIYAGDSTAHTTTPIAKRSDIKSYKAGNGIDITNDVISADSVLFTGTQAEWEQLSSAEKSAYTHVCFTDDESGQFDIYSTSEIKTNKVWIDGKPIYRKVIDIGALPNETSKSVNHGISSLGSVIRTYGIATNGTGHLPLPFVSLSGTHCIMYSILETTIDINAGVDRSAYSGWIAIEYTKTTD